MSPLRQRMVAHMRCRHFSPRTEESYLHAIEQLYLHYRRMPDRLSRDEVVGFLAHCVHERKLSRSTVNVYLQSCRFLYEQVLERDPLDFKLPKRSRPKTRPQMLSPEECRRVVEAPKGLKHRALLHMVYGSGLRVSEVVRLLPRHIESDRMMVFVKGGKGGKDRYTVLSEKALEELRAYWRRHRPVQWLFPGRPEDRPLSEASVQQVYHLHLAVPGGVWRKDTREWVPAKRNWLFRAESLAARFRTRYLKAVAHKLKKGQLALPPDGACWESVIERLARTDWIVYAKKPFAGPQQVLEYLGRYTHKVAISDYRILAIENGKVTFRYRDRADGDVEKTKTLPAATFIRRFLLHILPKGLQKIRFCGWMGRNVRRENLHAIRQSIGVPPPEREAPPAPICPTCPCCAKAALVLIGAHQPRAPPPVCRGRTGREAA